MLREFTSGEEVRRPGPYCQGVGPVLKVVRVEDHRPVDGPHTIGAILYLSDGTWEFRWNVVRYVPPPKPAPSILDGSALALADVIRLGSGSGSHPLY